MVQLYSNGIHLDHGWGGTTSPKMLISLEVFVDFPVMTHPKNPASDPEQIYVGVEDDKNCLLSKK